MARRSGRMFLSKQNPMLTQKFGALDPDYASNYDMLSGGGVDTTNYNYSSDARDLNGDLVPGAQYELEEKSKKLDAYKKKYGSEMDNYIAGQFQQNSVDHIASGSIPLMNNATTMTEAQDEFLRAIELQEYFDKIGGVRDAKSRVKRAKQNMDATYGRLTPGNMR